MDKVLKHAIKCNKSKASYVYTAQIKNGILYGGNPLDGSSGVILSAPAHPELDDGFYNKEKALAGAWERYDTETEKECIDWLEMIESAIKNNDYSGMASIPAETYNLVLSYASKEDIRYYLCGIAFSDSRMRSTDGHRLIDHKSGSIVLPENEVFIVPRAALDKIKPGKKECVSITFYKTGVKIFSSGSEIAAYALHVDGTFPNTDRIIPDASQMQKTQWSAEAYAKHAKQIKALCKAENLKAVILKDSCAHVGEYSFNGLPCDIPEATGFNPDFLAAMPSGTLYYKDNDRN